MGRWFFDGEGSTFAKSDSDRPGYFQLSVTVPQSGRDGTPEVLLRFQRAVLGMGVIDAPNKDFVYRWRARGFVDAQATLALIWRFLGDVKRDQAAAAMRAVMDQYRSGRYPHRRPRSPSSVTPHAAHAVKPTANDHDRLERAWAAGLFDAEGWIGLKRSGARPDAPDWYRVRASVSQHGAVGATPQVLERFAAAVGVGRIERHGEADDFKWVCEHLAEIESTIDTLDPWLGVKKREQATEALQRFSAQVRLRGNRERCARGHPYHGYRMKAAGMRHICNACARLRDRAERAARGIPPRQFKNVSRRYTS